VSQILVRQGMRCQEHPHRTTEQKCDRCGQPFCEECLTPSERLADGTRKWHCARCVWLIDEERKREALERSLGYKASIAARRTRIALVALGSAAVLIGATAAGYFVFARQFGSAAPEQVIAERAAGCGELTRIRSIGAIGTQGAADAINVLSYPQRAAVSLLPLAGGVAPPGAGEAGSIVDECNVGWRAGTASLEELQLPLTLELNTQRDSIFIQRIALWQDPEAPRASWVREFEALASPSESGEDFVPLPLDREGVLRESTEAQWFEIQRPFPGSTQKFPDVLPMRRLRLRILSTVGVPRRGVKVDQVSVGEIAAFGPDLEIVISDGQDSPGFSMQPGVVQALAGQTKFLLFMNTGNATHRLVSVGQQQNFDFTIGPREVKSVNFIAGRPGRYEFVCRIPGHATTFPGGSIQVR
jgi:hypothetical protein